MKFCLFVCLLGTLMSTSIAQVHHNMAEVIDSTPNLSELVALINANNSDLLKVTLKHATPHVTLFAPNDQAVLNFKRDYPNEAENATIVRDIILNHLLVNRTVGTSDILSNTPMLSAMGVPLWFYKTSEQVTVNEAKVVAANMMASNGVIHMIDEVLYPMGVAESVGEVIRNDPAFSGLKALVDRHSDVKSMIMNHSHVITLFAPVNDVLPSPDTFSSTEIDALLKRHIVVNNVLFAKYFNRDGRIGTYHGDMMTKYMMHNVYLENSDDLWSRVISSGGISTLNGAIHRINGVLGLSSGVNLMEALGLNGLTQLKNKVHYENLDTALKDLTQNFTIFAPSNSAFEKFSNQQHEPLSTILKRHVIKGPVLRSDLKESQVVQTLNSGEQILVMKINGKVYVEFNGIQATVISADKRATNGVIHFIDTVLSGAPHVRLSVGFLVPVILSLIL